MPRGWIIKGVFVARAARATQWLLGIQSPWSCRINEGDLCTDLSKARQSGSPSFFAKGDAVVAKWRATAGFAEGTVGAPFKH